MTVEWDEWLLYERCGGLSLAGAGEGPLQLRDAAVSRCGRATTSDRAYYRDRSFALYDAARRR